MKKLVVPKFETEAEEARWWDEHMDSVEENLVEAIETGTARRGGPRRILEERQKARASITVPVTPEDLSAIHDLAQREGKPDEVIAGALLRDAVQRRVREKPV
ncbi:MAG: hypothetical protein ACKV22_16545 [Bryobacteraceae bacterium]